MDNTTRLLKEEISRIMEALNEQMLIIEEHESRIPQIEIDLIMENIRELYTALKDLNKINSREYIKPVKEQPVQIELQPVIPLQQPVVESIMMKPKEPEFHAPEPVPVQPPPPQAPVPEPVIPEIKAEEPKPEPAEETPVLLNFRFKEPIRFEPIAEPEPQPEPEPEPEPVIPEPVIIPKEVIPEPPVDLFHTPASPSLADKFKDEKKTLNDRLQQEKQEMTLSSRLQQNAISDVKTAIGINEKFQFINELFAGSMQDYTQAINQLNQFKNLEEAIGFIDILKFKYNWDMNADGFRKIMEIVRRRYP